MNSKNLFEIRDFRLYLWSRFLMTLAWQGQSVAVAWQVYSMTKDPLSLGLVGLIEVVPSIVFAFVAGHLVDRHDRKMIVLRAQALIISVSVMLFVLSLDRLSLPTSLHLWLIYSCLFCLGIGRAFLGTAQFAFFGQILDREHYVKASTWVSTAWQVAATLGPAIAGIVYGQSGAAPTFFLCALLASLASIAMGIIPGRGKTAILREENFVQSLTAGIRFVLQTKALLGALCLDLFAVLFGGAVALLPIFADYLNAGPEGLGILRAAPFVGAFLSALWLTQRPPKKNVGTILLIAVAGFGLSMIGFALSKDFVTSLLLLALSGGFDAVSVVVRASILQLSTPDSMRGRVSAVNSIFISSSNELGAFESGVAAKWLGVIPSVVVGGAMTLIVVVICAVKFPELRKLEFKE